MKNFIWIGLAVAIIAFSACKNDYVCDYSELIQIDEEGNYNIDTSIVSIQEVRFDLDNKEAQEARSQCELKGGEWYRYK